MRSRARRYFWLLLLPAAACCVTACEQKSTPAPRSTTQPASAPVRIAAAVSEEPDDPPPPPNPLIPESKEWSLDVARERLADDDPRVQRSAAVRLVMLSDVEPLCVPKPLPDELAAFLKVMTLSEERWALGWETPEENRLASPVLIDANGKVTLPVEGAEEEVAILRRTDMPRHFPHLLITPQQVLVIDDEVRTGLSLETVEGLHFEVRGEDEFPYVALLFTVEEIVPGTDETAEADESAGPIENDQPAPGTPASQPADADPNTIDEPKLEAQTIADSAPDDETISDTPSPPEPVEVAKYQWDAYELMFVGPICNRLPEPPGGTFELNLERSVALIPVGGLIPDKPEFAPPAQQKKEEPLPF